MKLTFLGTCAGTEPVAGRHHSSLAIEHAGGLYWLDAGEHCGYAGHLLGLDLQRTRAVFITHTHMDHIGGLGHLLWTIRKLETLLPAERQRLRGGRIDVFLPVPEVWQGLWQMLVHTEGNFATAFEVVGREYSAGVVYDADGFRLRALGNTHLPIEDGRPRSYSFRVEAGGRSLVYSGDVAHVREIEPLLEGADLVLMETGHHRVDAVCQFLRPRRPSFGRLGFVHHGREILADPADALRRARDQLGQDTFLAEDGMSIEV